jgi:hypothetical protein
MLDAPRQDWSLYESFAREADAAWIRRLTASDRLAMYADLFNMLWRARQPAGHNELVEQRRWQEKLKLRQCSVNAFAKLDQARRERTAAEDAS